MRLGAIATMVAFVVLAGCASPQEAVADEDKAPVVPEALAGSELGAVQGHVYSDELKPIAGARVGLTSTASEDVTDADGLFVLADVPPGKYVLAAGRLGYLSVGRNVEVVAGEVLEIDLTLQPIKIEDEPYPQTLQISGYLECGMGSAAMVAPCTYPYRLVHGNAANAGVNLSTYGLPPDLHANRFWLNITIPPGVQELIAELMWTPGSAAAQQMNLFILCGDFDPTLNECNEKIRYGKAGGHAGKSPIQARIDAKEFRTKGCPASKYCLKDKPIWIANDVAMPYATPPQAAFQQKFEVWDTLFFNGMGPETFTALPDT